MADWSKPALTDTYANFLSFLTARDLDVVKMLDPATVTLTNTPTGAIRWNSSTNKFEKYSGTAWADLAATYAISISGSAGSVPWSGVSSKPTTVSGFGITDAITTANIGTQTVDKANKVGSNGGWATFTYTAQAGQPTYVWGTNDGLTFYPWNPSNFAVTSATSATTAANATKLATARTLSVSLVTTGSSTGASFDGSANAAMTVRLNSSDVTNALGFTPLGSTGGTISGALTISASGTPLIANSTNSTANKISLQDNGTIRGYIGASSSFIGIIADTLGVAKVTVASDGAIAASGAISSTGNISAGNSITATNNITAGGTITSNSDERLKEAIEPITRALDRVLRWRGVSYVRRDTGEAMRGVIAQELQSVTPELVKTDERGILSVAYPHMAGDFIEAFRELKAQIDAIKIELHFLRG